MLETSIAEEKKEGKRRINSATTADLTIQNFAKNINTITGEETRISKKEFKRVYQRVYLNSLNHSNLKGPFQLHHFSH